MDWLVVAYLSPFFAVCVWEWGCSVCGRATESPLISLASKDDDYLFSMLLLWPLTLTLVLAAVLVVVLLRSMRALLGVVGGLWFGRERGHS